MKYLMLVIMLVATQSAMAMISSADLTCQEAAALVSHRGAIILSTGKDTFQRYVTSGYYCAVALTPQPAWVPTKDSAQCFVGYTCEPFNHPGT